MLRKSVCAGLIALIFFTSCSQKTQTTTTKAKADKTALFTISFISYGTGIDYAEMVKLDSLIQNNKGCTIQVEKKNWGKEGETDYCFYADNLKCLQEWKAHLQQQLNIKDRVQLIENKNCGEGH